MITHDNDTSLRLITADDALHNAIHHYGCVVILCENGSATVSVNQRPMRFRHGDLLILTSDLRLTTRHASRDFSARCVSIPEQTFNAVYYKITNIALWDYLYNTPILHLDKSQHAAVAEWMNQLEWAIQHLPRETAGEIAANATHTLFMAIDAQLAGLYTDMQRMNKDRTWQILTQFFSLLYRHYATRHDVEFYASAMNISADYLTKACRRVYGMSAKKLINEQITEELKFQLTNTGKTISEMASALNFEDSSYLCRFFRRETGMSPVEYRNAFNNRNAIG